MNSIGPVEADYGSEAALKAHYRAVRERLSKPRVVPQLPPPAPKPTKRRSRFSTAHKSRPVFVPIVFEGNVRHASPHELRFPMTAERRIRLIVASCALKWKVTTAEIMAHRRSLPIARARQEAMARVAAKMPFSLPRIGKIFNRDHTTVLHAIRLYKRHPEKFSAIEAGSPRWEVGFEAAE